MNDPTALMNKVAGRTTTRSKSTAIGTAVAKARAAEKAKQDAVARRKAAEAQRRRRVKPQTSGEIHSAKAKGGYLPADLK